MTRQDFISDAHFSACVTHHQTKDDKTKMSFQKDIIYVNDQGGDWQINT